MNAKKLWWFMWCITFLVGCDQTTASKKLATLTVKNDAFTHVIEERCKLQARYEYDIRAPQPHNRVRRKGKMTITYLAEEGSVIRKGELVAEVGINQLPEIRDDWLAEVKIAQAILESEEKNLVVEKHKLQMNVEKQKAALEEKNIRLQLLKLPDKVQEVTAQLAVKEAKHVALQHKELFKSSVFLSQKNLVSNLVLSQKELQYLDSIESIKDKKVQLQILKMDKDPLQILQMRYDIAMQKIFVQQAQNDLLYKEKGLYSRVARAKRRLHIRKQRLGLIDEFSAASKIYSPGDGIVIYHKTNNEGQRVKFRVGLRVRRRQRIMSIQDISQMLAVVAIPERQIALIQDQQQVQVKVDSVFGKTFRGRITKIDREAHSRNHEQKQRETLDEKFFRVYIQLDQDGKFLKPGLTGTAKISTRSWNNVVSLPSTSLIANSSSVYIYHNGQLQQKEVEIISQKPFVVKGLADNTQVVIDARQVSQNNTVQQQATNVVMTETGILQPRHSEIVFAGRTGELIDILPSGTEVKKGDKITSIAYEAEADLDLLDIEKQMYESEIDQMHNELILSQKNQQLEMDKALLDITYARLESTVLRQQPYKEQIEKAKVETKKAQLAVETARAAYEAMKLLSAKGVASETELLRHKLQLKESEANLIVAKLQEKLARTGPSPQTMAKVQQKLELGKLKLEHTRKTVNSIIKVRKIALQVKKSEKKEIEYQLYLHEKEYPKRGTYRANGPGVLYYVENKDGEPQIGNRYNEGTELAIISDQKRMVVKTKVHMVDYQKIQVGQKATIKVRALPQRIFTGEVIKIAQVAIDRGEWSKSGAKTGVTVFEVIVAVSGLNPILRNGMSARVDFLQRKE
ncbi:HlyD family efflux transporter periplasmic adaptor subunit [Candidatus Uabimicrobium amorphum]|uniref:Hemolysin D n=1 Tax=Uabimicrobium amorphum TaxID=2596890 RepID=A0A5S9F1E7_UABAM|nr:HlyD family efflux transporter periplasmic adaptor subunit [Candidatus Uabimicrobium amorphum]BBM82111.1 hemolysin D [Candidatus Uabimicrobium amorphum]